MNESGAVLNKHGRIIHVHNPLGRSGGYLPDSKDLWDVLWANRASVAGFVHSHPGSGVPGPSYEDVTTFSAVERGLGLRLDWWIVTIDNCCFIRWTGPGKYDYTALPVRQEMPWAYDVRYHSGMTPR